MPFLTAAWAFAKTIPWWAYLAAVLVVALGVQTLRVRNLKSDLAGDELQIVALQNAVKVQNAAVAELGAVSANKQAKSADALKEAVKAGSSARQEAARLRAMVGRQATCTDAVGAVREGLK